ncbi:MAG: ribokinase [Lachnospiraceae bacterium]|nr:ribokinase [Lachnospiraceae bacterium]
MVKIAVIGICGNSVFMNTDHFHEKGETIVADSVYEEIGGKGINQAVAAARMGAEVSFLTAVGDDRDGQTCMQIVEAEGIKGTFCVKKDERTTFAFILTDKHGENQVTGYHGAELAVEDVLAFEKEIAGSDILLLQQEVPNEVNEMAVRLAKKYDVKVILNPAPIREISEEMAESVFMVTPNEQEKQAIDISRFQNVVTTLGKRGCLINEEIMIPAIHTRAVDTTGAGDTFNGVLAVCLAEGMDLSTSCKYAVTASGISVGRKYVLNAIPYREEIERRLRDDE